MNDRQVDKIVKKVQEAVCHFDATLRQFIVDDKGTVAIVVFGLPPIYHEAREGEGKMRFFLISINFPVDYDCLIPSRWLPFSILFS